MIGERFPEERYLIEGLVRCELCGPKISKPGPGKLSFLETIGGTQIVLIFC